MNVEARIIALEERVSFLEAKVKDHEPKFDQVLMAVVDVHKDLKNFETKVDRLEANLPTIIARAVAPLLSDRSE
jgi:uncharacterized coiled-coil protein SlyX